jgi:tetratricopeptide (TPR) repeat protein
LDEAYFNRALYYINNGKTKQGIEDFNNVIKYNPNNWKAYGWAAYNVYLSDLNYSDYVKGLEYIFKAISINHGRELPVMLSILGAAYTYEAGFSEEGEKFFLESFKLNGDTSLYLASIGSLEIQYGNFEKGIEKSLKAYAKDSDNLRVANQYFSHGMYKESLKYFKKYSKRLKSSGQISPGDQLNIGYAYWQNGYKKEAEYWFNEQKKVSEESIRLGRVYSMSWSRNANYDLAALYAFKGEKEKAYENLRIIDRSPIFPLKMVDDIKQYNPFFNSIRSEPEFQQIVKDVEAKYQAEHERVKKWLEEQGKL